MRIGTLNIDVPLFAAPLAGYSDRPMRILAQKFGADMVYSEMLKTAAVVRLNRRTMRMAALSDAERPVALQLAGRDPDEVADAARILEEFHPDAFDFNVGCPVRKIVREGAGSALLKEPDLVRRILHSLRKAVTVPLTVKTRLGWDTDSHPGAEIARIAEGEGADAVIVHGRTAARQFHGQVDLDGIAAIVDSVSIPVIGNGSIRNADDALGMMHHTGCDGVMIGRAAIGNPWIFAEVRAALTGKATPPRPPAGELRAVIREHYDLICDRYGEGPGTKIFRKHAARYVRGRPDSKAFRCLVMKVTSRAGLEDLLRGSLGT